MPPIRCLLFDLGGVLVRNVGFDRLNQLLPAPMEQEALKARLLASPSFRAFELGRCSAEVFADAFVRELGLRCSPADFIDEFRSWPQGFFPGVDPWLAALRQRYRVACLSNSNALHWERFGGFRAHFDVSLSSHLLGVIKPDADCFQRALAECGCAAAEVLFLDDALVNVQAARASGLRAEHVVGFDAARAAVELHAGRGMPPGGPAAADR